MKFAVAAAVLTAGLLSLGVIPARAAVGPTAPSVQPTFEVAKSVKKRAAGKKPGKAKKARATSGRK